MRLIVRHRLQVVLIEDKASRIQLIQELRDQCISCIKAVTAKGIKQKHLNARTPRMEGGFVKLPKQAPWEEPTYWK